QLAGLTRSGSGRLQRRSGNVAQRGHRRVWCRVSIASGIGLLWNPWRRNPKAYRFFVAMPALPALKCPPIHNALPQLLTSQDIHTSRVDGARTDSIDANAVRCQLLGQRLGEALYGEVRRTVGRRVRHTPLPHNRGEVDNSPALVLLQQRGNDGFTEQKRSHHLDVQHTAKQFLAEFDDWYPVSAA